MKRHIGTKIDGQLGRYAVITFLSGVFELFYFEATTKALSGSVPEDNVPVVSYAFGFVLMFIISIGTVVWAWAPLGLRGPVVLKDLPRNFEIVGTVLNKQVDLNANLIGVSGAFWTVAGIFAYFSLSAPASPRPPLDSIVTHINSQCNAIAYLFFGLPIVLSAALLLTERQLILSATTLLETGWDDTAYLKRLTAEEVSRIQSKTLSKELCERIVTALYSREGRYIVMVNRLNKLLLNHQDDALHK